MKRDCPPFEVIMTVCGACDWMGRELWLWVWTRVWTGKLWVWTGIPWVCICFQELKKMNRDASYMWVIVFGVSDTKMDIIYEFFKHLRHKQFTKYLIS